MKSKLEVPVPSKEPLFECHVCLKPFYDHEECLRHEAVCDDAPDKQVKT